MGLKLAAVLSGSSTPFKRHSAEVTPPATPSNDITTSTTPGIVPPPPPTPVVGPGGIPIPPPPPPSLSSSSSQPHMKRVNWQKMARTDGTVWGEVGPIPMFSYYHSPIPLFSYHHSLIPHSSLQLSGLDEAIELAELESQFAFRKSKGQQTSPHPHTLPTLTHIQSPQRP